MVNIVDNPNFNDGSVNTTTITFPNSNYKFYIDGVEVTDFWHGEWKGGINPNPEKEQLIKDMFNLFNGKVNNLSDEDICLYMMLTNKDKEATLSDIKKFQSYVNKAREENKLYGRESWKRRY